MSDTAPHNPTTPWTRGDAVFAGAYVLVLAYAGLTILLHPSSTPRDFPGLAALLPSLILSPLVAFLLLLVRKTISQAPFSAFFGRERIGLTILCGAGCGLCLFLCTGLVAQLVEMFAARVFHYTPAMQDAVRWLLSPDTPVLAKAVLCLHAALFAPFAEEILFRGALLSSFAKRGSLMSGFFITSTLFALCHGNALALLPLFLVGWILAFYALDKGLGLLFSIAAHVAFNLLNLAIILFFPSLAL